MIARLVDTPATTSQLAPESPTTTDDSPAHDATRELVVQHLWLSDTIARRFRGRGEDDEDLQQVARCALIEAAHRYEPEKGPFPPFAGPTISGVLKRHFRDHGWVVRPPRQTQQLAVRITQQWSGIAQEQGGVPTDQELADSLGETVSNVREARRASQGYRTVPLDGPTAPATNAGMDDPGFGHCEARLLVQQAWALLSREERELLRMRFWEQRSQSDIATCIGTSQMQVSRLLSRLLDRLRRQLADNDSAAVPSAAPRAA